MCELAVFQWLGYASSCPKIIPLGTDDDFQRLYQCRILDFAATADTSGRVYGLSANLSCTFHVGRPAADVSASSDITEVEVMPNGSAVLSGRYFVPVLPRRGFVETWLETHGYEDQPVLLLNDSSCFLEADDETLLHHGKSAQFCPDFDPDQPLGCCIGPIDAYLDWKAAAVRCVFTVVCSGGLFWLWVLLFRGYRNGCFATSTSRSKQLV